MSGIIHQTAVEYLVKKDPDLKTKGFEREVRNIFPDDDELLDYALTLVPDAYKVIDGGQYENCFTVVICEIEGAPLLNNEEMKKVVTLWQLLDFEAHTLEIKIYSRYGHLIKDKNIQDYHKKIIEDKNKK